MNQGELFGRLGYVSLIVDGKEYYQGNGTCLFRITEDQEAYYLIARDPAAGDNSKERVRQFFKLLEKEETEEILTEYIVNYFDRAESIGLRSEEAYARDAQYIRRLIGRRLTKEQWKNLCRLYYLLIKAGDRSSVLSDACMKVIRINRMTEDNVDPELHRLLLKVPDLYYDFIQGVEGNVFGENAYQKTLIRFLQRNPMAETVDVIVANSILRSYPGADIPYLEEALGIIHENRSFSIEGIPEAGNEVTVEKNKRGWKLASVIIGGTGYTLRHSGAVVLLDYRNICVGGSILRQRDENTAQIASLGVGKDIQRDKLIDKLIDYDERVVKKAGFRSLFFHCFGEEEDIAARRGYIRQKDHPMESGQYHILLKEL